MNQTFKKKVIAVSVAAALGMSIGMTLVADAQANMFETTTQAATAATVPTITGSTAAGVALTGQTFTLTEVAAGDFTASTAGTSFINLNLFNSGGTANAGTPTWLATTGTTTSTAFKVSAPTFIGIAAATMGWVAATGMAAGDSVTLGINNESWVFLMGTTTGVGASSVGPVTVYKNNVAQSTTGVPIVASGSGLADLIATTLNNSYGVGTAAASTSGANRVLTVYSSNAYFNTAITNGYAGSTTLASPDVSVSTTGTVSTAASGVVLVANSSTAAFTPSIVADASPIVASTAGNGTTTNTALLIPILKNSGTTAGTITLSKMSVTTNTSTLGDVKVKVGSNSTAAGVSKGSSTVVANAAALKVTGSFGTAVTATPNSVITAPDITLVENLPAALYANSGAVIFTLNNGAYWTGTPVVSATSLGGTTTVGTVAFSAASGSSVNNVMTFTVSSAGSSTTFPSTVKISGETITIPSTVATGTAINAVVSSTGQSAAMDAGLTVSTGYNVANVQSGTIAAALVGTAPNVYTQRTYSAGSNGGAVATSISLTENSPGAIPLNTSLNIDFTNATFVNSTTGTPDFGGTSLTGAFTLTGSSAMSATASPATVVTAGGYNASGTTFANGAATWTVSAASTTLTNARKVTFPGLIVGNTVGPVKAKLTSNTLGAASEITIANAVEATSTSVSGSLASPALNGAAVSLPTIVISETAAGALATSTGGPGNVSVALNNASFDTSATAKWCGNAITATNITGGNTSTLTVNLPSVSTTACTLELTSAAKANLSAANGAGITAVVNSSLADTAQATRKEVVVGSVGATSSGSGVSSSIPAATATGSLTSQTVTGSLTPASSDLGSSGSVYVAAILPSSMGGGAYFLTPPTTWTLYNGATTPNAYSTGTLASVPTVNIVSSMDISTLVGTTVYVGYGKGNPFNPAGAFNDMINKSTYSMVYTVK